MSEPTTHLGRDHLDGLLCLHLVEAHLSPNRRRCSSAIGHDPRIQGAFCLNKGPSTRARTRMWEIDRRAVYVCDDDLARTGSGRVTGTGRWVSGRGGWQGRQGREITRVDVSIGLVVQEMSSIEGSL